MRTVVQRVSSASVTVEGIVRARIERGLLVLVGLEAGDTVAQLGWMGEKVANLRIFEDEAGPAKGKMNRSVIDVAGSILLVPNFTLAGDCQKGRRPSFDRAMPPALAEPMFEQFVKIVGALAPVQSGVFQASMRVELVNDGPVTLVIDAPPATP